ncbi:hypothetical protein SAMN05660209_01278 [Geodermatophilus africanus]|uniref:Uncharacterized protein n=1 Tax=Geodermatophilus africanus TaxID=1137993 RepID=A0A1H3ENL6_9ACTN|nr:hypothetical protein [Geodermatophilus africanus]SDX79738.1 hypothetical protein SAMN05660209_01278 [Geodermatophilus africanus]
MWELVIANKLALTVTGVALVAGDGARDASSLVVWDGTLSLVLIAAYVTCRAWDASPPLHRHRPSGG